MLWKGAKSVDMDEQVVCRVFTEGEGEGEGADVVHGHARQCGPKRGCSSPRPSKEHVEYWGLCIGRARRVKIATPVALWMLLPGCAALDTG